MDLGNAALPIPQSAARTNLKALVRQASAALAQLDSARLEELAESCRMLTAVEASEARDALNEMASLHRVLDATRANCAVMHKLRALRAGSIEYGERQVQGWSAECAHGHN